MNDGTDCNDAIDVKIIFDKEKMLSNFNTRTKHNDIALLELEDNVDQYFSFSLFPACLHHESKPINDLTVSSWSREIESMNLKTNDTLFAKRTNWLQKFSMQEVTLEKCIETFKKYAVTIVETQICATSPMQGNITCQIFSASPLHYKLNNTYYVAGLASYGVGCGANFPDVFTRVSSYIDWIESIVWP